MKKALFVLIILLIVLTLGAYADELVVSNCSEFVSLRATPSVSSDRLTKVPLGAVVENCVYCNEEFTYCEYDGFGGYVLTRYLEPLESGAPVDTDEGTVLVVTNCTEYVSLRATPSTSANCVVRVPLGAPVTNCASYDERFTYCEYDGRCGFILSDYLKPNAVIVATDALSENGYTVAARRTYDNNGEQLYITLRNADGTTAWEASPEAAQATELTQCECIAGGTADTPVVYIHDQYVLTAHTADTGTPLWQVPMDELSARAGITAIGDTDGTLYLIGYYNDAPCAVNADGGILWLGETSDGDYYWAYEMELSDGILTVWYESINAPVRYDTATGMIVR